MSWWNVPLYFLKITPIKFNFYDLMSSQQFERNYFFKININTGLIFKKKAMCPKFPFKITSHQNFLSSALLTKSGSFAALPPISKNSGPSPVLHPHGQRL